MTNNAIRIGIVRSVYELLGIVLVRFRPLQRIWGAWLIAVNMASLLFIAHIEALVTLAVVGVLVLAQAVIYQRTRVTRVLGVTHMLWVPTLAWIALRVHSLPWEGAPLQVWLIILIATNTVSLAIDAWDASRFVRGERQPYYAW